MRRFALIVVMLGACEKKAPRYEGPLRLELGDCAEDAVWVSGPRPAPPDQRVAKKPDDKQPDVASNDPDEGGESGGAFASLTGTGDISSGFDDSNVYGRLLGNEVGEMSGGFGYTRSGPPSGGTGWGTIGTGRYGTIGRGSGTGGYGVGGGRGGMRGRFAKEPTVSIGQPAAQGDLDKAIIRRYIKRNIQKIQYCYEKELLAKTGLAGTVQTQFFIGPDGLVKSASGSGMDPEVSKCVASVIKAIEFPKPKDGGGVQVNYPFTFRPAAGSAPAGSAQPPKPEPPAPEPPKPEPPKPDKPSTAIAPTGGRYEPGASNPLASQKAEIEECLRRNAKPYGVATVKLTWNGSAVATAQVQGISDDVAECVSEAAKKVSPLAGNTKPQTCSFAFGEMPIAELPGVDISATSLDFAGEKLSTPAAVKDDPKTFKIDKLFERVEAAVKRDGATTAPVSIIGPLVIRAVDDTPIEVVAKTVSTILAANGDYVLAAKEPPSSWRLLKPDVVPPIAPVPLGAGRGWSRGRSHAYSASDEERVALSILLNKDRIWVGLSRVNEFYEVPKLPSGEHDWEKLEVTLKIHKTSAFFADRTDLEVAGEGVTYIDLVHTIDIAARVGFVDYRFSDPRALSARPML